MQTQTPGGLANPTKRYLQSLNVGLCMRHSRLLGFQVEKSTRSTIFLWPQFVVQEKSRVARTPEHLDKAPLYPDIKYYLNQVQLYFFRHRDLRHLRLGQYFRYFSHRKESIDSEPKPHADQVAASQDRETIVEPEYWHRHYDTDAQSIAPGETFHCSGFPVSRQCSSAHRRGNLDFCVPRSGFLEPMGAGREAFYEQRLLLGLPWFCNASPGHWRVGGTTKPCWTFTTPAPEVPPELKTFSMIERRLEHDATFEQLCLNYENAFAEYSCECCEGKPPLDPETGARRDKCRVCVHALGWHQCEHQPADETQWRRGTLHDGKFDIASSLWTLARRLVPLHVLKAKLDQYVIEGHIEAVDKDTYIETFEQMAGVLRETNAFVEPAAAAAQATEEANAPMGDEELQEELRRRERLMQTLNGVDNVCTDQWRVYQEIIAALQTNVAPLRLCLQASAGTGKSFLLETVHIWCGLHGHCVQACAPTGIAAARLRVLRTPVRAYTVHYLFALSVELESKIDACKPEDERTAKLACTTVLIVDECSMIDDGCWDAMKDQLTTVGALCMQAPGCLPHPQEDHFGNVHLILSMDLKQLLPATRRPPFICADPQLLEQFDFRILHQNRRLASGTDAAHQVRLEKFHATLDDIAFGKATREVREFLVEAYVRGAKLTQDKVLFEGSTACFTKRRYRDRWNKRVLERIRNRCKRSLRVKAVFVARGTESAFVRESAAAAIRRSVRSQALTTLRLAGQWPEDPPLGDVTRPHCMRAMLVANMDVPQTVSPTEPSVVLSTGVRR